MTSKPGFDRPVRNVWRPVNSSCKKGQILGKLTKRNAWMKLKTTEKSKKACNQNVTYIYPHVFFCLIKMENESLVVHKEDGGICCA